MKKSVYQVKRIPSWQIHDHVEVHQVGEKSYYIATSKQYSWWLEHASSAVVFVGRWRLKK